MLTYYSAAKINLYLQVHGKMESGYHELTSVMQSISLFDRLDFDFQQRDFSLDTGNKNLGALDENTVTRSWQLMKTKFNLPNGVHVNLVKNIPINAGLAGGSSNGAAMLHATNDFFKLGLSVDELAEIGGEIGADVPFCVMGGTALATGKGEKLQRLPNLPNCQIPLVNSGISILTREIFEAYDAILPSTTENSTETILEGLSEHNLAKIASGLYNDLERVVLPKYPALQEQKNSWNKQGLYPLMSGSGPSIFALSLDDGWKKIMENWNNENGRLFFVRPVNQGISLYEKI